jgi:hypothetical protein
LYAETIGNLILVYLFAGVQLIYSNIRDCITVCRNASLRFIFCYIVQHIFPRIHSDECNPSFKMIASPNNQIHKIIPTASHSKQSLNSALNSDRYGPFFHSQNQTAYGTGDQYGQTNKQTNIHTYIHTYTHTHTHIKTGKKLTNVLSIPNIGANVGKYSNTNQNNGKHEL